MRSASQGLLGEHAEEPLHEIQPRRVGRREVQMEARVPEQPAMHDRRAVCRQVVQHDVDLERRVDARLDLAEKRDEIGGAVPRLASRQDLARWRRSAPRRGRACRCECSCASAARAARCPSARSVARASSAWICDFSSKENTAAFVGGFMYRPTTSRTFSISCGSGRDLERFGDVRFEAKRAPDAADGRMAHPRVCAPSSACSNAFRRPASFRASSQSPLRRPRRRSCAALRLGARRRCRRAAGR